MKKICLASLIFVLFTTFVFSILISNAIGADKNAQREWKSFSGRSLMTGVFEKFKPDDASFVYIRSSNGKLYQYPFDKLSKEDQEFIRSLDNEDDDLVELEEVPEENANETPANNETSNASSNTSNSRGSGNSVSRPDRQGKRYALLVGVNNYLDLNQLECAVSDIKLIHEKLIQVGFESDNIKMFITGNTIGKYPDKRTVENGFHDILNEADENSQIFIAFAGHGFEIDKVSYFAVEDTRTDTSEDAKSTAININAMLEELNNSKAASKWFIVDACREYMSPKRGSALSRFSRGISSGLTGKLPEGVFFLQSCKSSESSYEYNGNGLFTRNFAEALDGKADSNKDGDLTVMEVFEYVSTKVKKDAQNLLSKRQTPTYTIHGNTPNFTIASTANLLQYGLLNKDWEKIQKLYDECQKLLYDKKQEEALEKFDQALEMMKDADDDAPLKKKITIVSTQIRESIKEKERLRAEQEKLQEEFEKEKAALEAKLEEEKRKREEAEKQKTVVVKEQPRQVYQPQRPVYQAPTQFVYLGQVQSVAGDNSEARALAAQYGYRLPSPYELQQISRSDISGIPLDGWIETSDPNTVCDIFFQNLNPVQKRGTGRNLVVGCR